MKTRIIEASDLGQVVAEVGIDQLMDDMIASLTEALRAFDANSMEVTERSGFSYEAPAPGLLEWMPIHEAGERITIKIVGYHPENPDRLGVPTIVSTASVYDLETGHLKAVTDATFLTALRTAAASAVASRILARESSTTHGLIGCGAQAISQLHALSRVFDIDNVLIYDRNPATSRGFAGRVSTLIDGELPIAEAPIDDVVSAADILCTSTSVGVGEGPVFADRDTKPWLHVNAVGSDHPGKYEVPVSFLLRSLVCPDFRDQAVTEGECQQLSPEQIGPSLTEIVKNPDSVAHAREQTTVFDSTGWALEDHVSAQLVLDHCERLGLGSLVEIEATQGDPYSPYFAPGNGNPAAQTERWGPG